jgi:hypothetical protein
MGTTTQKDVRNAYMSIYRNIFQLIKNYKFLHVFTDELNKHTNMKTDFNDLVIQCIMHYMMLVSFVPYPKGTLPGPIVLGLVPVARNPANLAIN